MSINILKYYFVEGYKNLFKNKRATFASIVIMIFTLLLFGIFIIISKNINRAAAAFQENELIRVHIEVDATDSEIEELKKKVQDVEIDGEKPILNIRYKSKEEAEESLKKMLQDKKENIKFGNGSLNPATFLPASFLLKISKIELAPKIKAQIETMPNVRNVKDNETELNIILNIQKIIKIVSFAIITILVVASVLIISNTIKLTVYARRKEISIMKYIGATDDFIRGPFVIESLLIGLISTIIPVIVLGLLYEPAQSLIYNFNRKIDSASTVSILPFSSILPDIAIAFLLLSIGISVFGNLISMKRYLKV